MKAWWVIVAFVAAVAWWALVIALMLAILGAKDQANTAADSTSQVQQILIRSCEDNGNPLRTAVQQMLRDQIHQSHSRAVKHLGIPPRQLHGLIRRANAKRRREIHTIRPVDCAALYRH